VAYITNQDVEIRLIGKVRFTDDLEDENRFPRKLLQRLIKEAEGAVERDLSPRYAAPFQHADTGKFADLPDTTRETLRTMCELMAVIRVLGNDFGRGTVSNGGEFKDEQQRLYDGMRARELAKHHDGSVGQWKYPPMDYLLTSAQNSQDDGFHGVIVVSDNGDDAAFPGKQITDPAETFWNGKIDE
jgi:hypothetical protein